MKTLLWCVIVCLPGGFLLLIAASKLAHRLHEEEARRREEMDRHARIILNSIQAEWERIAAHKRKNAVDRLWNDIAARTISEGSAHDC